MAKYQHKTQPPPTLWVVNTKDGFRTYVSEKPALNFLFKLLENNEKAEIIQYEKQPNTI